MKPLFLSRHAQERAAERAPGMGNNELLAAISKYGVELETRFPSPDRFVLIWDKPDAKPVLAVVSQQTNGILTLLDAWSSDRGGKTFYSNIDGQRKIAGVTKRSDIRNACLKIGIIPPNTFITSPAPGNQQNPSTGCREFKLQAVNYIGKVIVKTVMRCPAEDEAQAVQAINKAMGMLEGHPIKNAVLRLIFKSKHGAPTVVDEWPLIGECVE